MKLARAAALSILALSYTGAARAAILLDGLYDSDYGAAKSVTHAEGAPTSNFGAPTNLTAGASYNVYLTNQGGVVYGLVQITGDAEFSAGMFSNLYFGNSVTSTIGFEITSQHVFKPNGPGPFAINYQTAVSATGIEFALPESLFTGPIGATGINAGLSPGDKLILRLSQSFGYSVAGGASYGADRLGAVTLSVSPVPGPIVGAGLPGLVMALGGLIAWRRRRTVAA